jgi:WD40 repeat protein
VNRWFRIVTAVAYAAFVFIAALAAAQELPPGALARLGTLRLRHENKVNAVAFSPDGKLLASGAGEDGGSDNTVRIWDVATGAERVRLVHRNSVYSVAFSPDGKIIASGGKDWAVHLWDPVTGRALRSMENAKGSIRALSFSPDGKSLASATDHDRTIRLWDVATGEPMRAFTATDPVNDHVDMTAVAFTPDGLKLAAGGGSARARLWEIASGKQLQTYGGEHSPRAEGLAISPDGRMLLTADGEVHVYNLANGEHQRKLGGNRTDVGGERIAISPDGKTVALGGVGIVRVWDISSDKEVYNIPTHGGFSGGVAFSPDGKHFAWGGYGNVVRIWETASGKELHSNSPQGQIFHVGFGPGGTTALVSEGTVRVWDMGNGRDPFAPDGRLGERLAGIGSVIGFSPDGKTIATGGYSIRVRFFDPVTGKEISAFAVPPDRPAIRAVFTSDGKHVVFLHDDMRTLSHWNLATGTEVCRFVGHSSPVDAMAVSPDGKLLITSGAPRAMMRQPPPVFKEDTGARVWNMATGKELRQFPSRDHSMAFSPDGLLLAAGNDIWVRLVDPITGDMIRRLEGPKYGAYRVAFSPDGKTLAAVGRDQKVWLWEVATGGERQTFIGHTGELFCVAFSPNGRRLLSGGADTTAFLWDAYTIDRAGSADLAAAIKALNGSDAATAYRAICALIADPDRAVPLLAAAVGPAEPADPQRLANLIADLDSNQFSAREKATADLAKLGDAAEPALRQLLAGQPSPEVRQRAEPLLTSIQTNTAPALLPAIRAIEVLEASASQAARRELERLAGGAPGVRLTREARAALDRISVRAERHWTPPAEMSPAEAEALLGGPVKGGVDADGKPLPPWAIARLGQPNEPGKGGPQYVPSQDARSAVVHGYNLPTIRILDLPSGRERKAIMSPTRSNWLSEVALSPDGAKLAADSSSGPESPTFLFVWDVASGKELWRSRGGVTGVGSLAWSPDSTMVATSGGEPRTIRVWDTAAGKERRNWSSPHHHTTIRFSADNKRLVATWPARRVLDIGTGNEVADMDDVPGTVTAGARPRKAPAPKIPEWNPTALKGPILFEPATGEVRLQLRGHPPGHDLFHVVLSPDRKTAASADNMGLLFFWDLTGLAPDGKFPAIELTDSDRAGLWRLLAGDDAALAYRAGWRLTAGGDESVAFIKRQLPPVPQDLAPHVEKFLADLNAPGESTRQSATERLECLGMMVAPDLRAALPGRSAGETRDRIAYLLDRANRPIPAGGLLQAIRAIEVLERIETPAARVALANLAAGRPDAEITREAVQTCRRMVGRGSGVQ